jgi:uncharacterized lipoprotein YmbA
MTWMLTRSIAATLVIGWLGTGCAGQSEPSNFYLLSYAPAAAGQDNATTMREGVALMVGPVELPQYLDRSQIVTRSGDNRLELEEFDRWGGQLKQNFTTVLAEVLSSELKTDRVSVYPSNAPVRSDYQVIVQVTAFESESNGRSVLDARWSIVDARQQSVLAMARSSLREDIASGPGAASQAVDYEAVAAAMSRNVAALGRDIAARITALAAK